MPLLHFSKELQIHQTAAVGTMKQKFKNMTQLLFLTYHNVNKVNFVFSGIVSFR